MLLREKLFKNAKTNTLNYLYSVNTFDELNRQPSEILANKIFTTFCAKDALETTVTKIKQSYTILRNKLFVFTSPQTEEYIITYSIDTTLASEEHIISNTLLLHRNSDYKVLYSINALRSLDPDRFDIQRGRIEIDWQKYEKSILLTRRGEFTQLKTELFDIILA